MELVAAEKLARELMAQFGLFEQTPAWRFEFDDAKRRFGCCHRSVWQNKITLSRILVFRNDREQVEDTIRHEIAHALASPKGGHGLEWESMCKRTGAKPVRCYSYDDVDAPWGDWRATCNGCGRVHHKFRRPKRERWCAAKECTSKNGRRSPLQLLTWRHKDALPESVPNAEQRRKAIEATKAQLRAAEPGSDMMQCVKCDDKSLGCTVCPGCGGELLLATVLQAQKEELKRKIAELERKLETK